MIATAPQNDMSVRVFFRTVYMPLRLTDASKSCIEQMEVAINRFDVFLGRESLLSDLTETTMATFLADGLKRGLSPVTCNMRAKHLATIWRLARRKRATLSGDVPEDLDGLSYLRVVYKLPRAWLPEEMDRILQSCRLSRGSIVGIDSAAWWEALILTLYDTGLRRTAAFAIRFDEIDLAEKMLRVPAERMKNRTEQYFRLSEQTLQAIAACSRPPRALVFPWPFHHHRALYDRLRRILIRAGLPAGREDLFHKIRRTTGSQLAMIVGEHAAIQQLGHKHAGTIKRYIDPRFTSNHHGALLLPRPNLPSRYQPNGELSQLLPGAAETMLPSALQAASAAVPEVEIPLSFPKPHETSFIESLKGKSHLTVSDLRHAIKAMGLTPTEFAEKIGANAKFMCKLVKRSVRTLLTEYMEDKVRIGLGLSLKRTPQTMMGMSAFITERCEIGPRRQIASVDLYAAFVEWCLLRGRQSIESQAVFGRMLRVAVPGLKITQMSDCGKRPRVYQGVSMKVKS